MAAFKKAKFLSEGPLFTSVMLAEKTQENTNYALQMNDGVDKRDFYWMSDVGYVIITTTIIEAVSTRNTKNLATACVTQNGASALERKIEWIRQNIVSLLSPPHTYTDMYLHRSIPSPCIQLSGQG
jgi:hypothetical protein